MARSMGGGGSRGGGGRSMGGGGSRSGSRSFSGGGRSRSSSSGGGGNRHMSGSSGFGGSGSHYGGPHHGGPHHGGPGMPPPRPHYHHHHTYYGRRPYRSSASSGCSTIAAFMIIMFIVIFSMIGRLGSGFSSGSNQKLNRDKYNGAVDSSHGYYIDNSEGDAKFIDRSNETALISGFKNFYNKTGVFPFLYIIEYTPDKSEYSGYDTYQDMLYEKLFTAEGNLLILYIAEEDDYYFAAGYDTGEVIDEQSINVICDKVNAKWYTGDLAQAFGDGLEDAAKNIMAKSNFRAIMTVVIIAVTAIIIVSILYKWWKSKKAQENKEQEDLEKILSTPLDTFGSDINDLAKKYDE